MNAFGVWRGLRRKWRLVQSLGVKAEDVVLEVGSGQAPNPRANVLCDLYVADDTERNRNRLILDRPLVVGDVQRLPFLDGSFDYVICSHVLEHVEDPALAAAELSRVARRGYVEVPSRLNERMIPYPFHRWLVTRDTDGTLLFSGKDDPVPDSALAAWFSRVEERLPGWSDFYFDHVEALGNVHAQRWDGEIRIRVDGAPGKAEGSTVAAGSAQILAALEDVDEGSLKERLLRSLWKPLRARSSRGMVLEPRLACPTCRGALASTGGATLACPDCSREFPVAKVRGFRIPILIP